jgi:hypothetical protein
MSRVSKGLISGLRVSLVSGEGMPESGELTVVPGAGPVGDRLKISHMITATKKKEQEVF